MTSLSGDKRSLHVRPAVEADAAAIASIYNAGIRARIATFETRERTEADVLAWLATPRMPVLVAQHADERRREGGSDAVIGFIAASKYRDRDCYAGIVEFSVYVDPGARGRGVGSALMDAFLEAVRELGYWKVLSRIFPENGASLGLCARHGFRQVGVYERHGRLDGEWRDVVIVERLLT